MGADSLSLIIKNVCIHLIGVNYNIGYIFATAFS